MKTDSASCPPSGFRVLLSIATMMKWFITKIDVKSAFLQSGPATRNVYVIPPKECKDRTFYCLLLIASYRLVNANAKWQLHSDTTLQDCGLLCVVHLPQLFYKRKDGQLWIIVAKVVDDILVAGSSEARKWLVAKLSSRYAIGTILHTPGRFLFFGLTIEQDEKYTVILSCDDKLNCIEPPMITRQRRKQLEQQLNSVETFSFHSTNGCLGFLGITASPFASFATTSVRCKM